MYKLFSLAALILLIFSTFIHAQTERCGTISTNSSLSIGSKEFEKQIQTWITSSRASKTTATLRIPVIVHVIHSGESIGQGRNLSEAQIRSQIDVLNEDFNRLNTDASQTLSEFQSVAGSMDIQFVLAQIDPNGFPMNELGIHRYQGPRDTYTMTTFNSLVKPLTIWDPTKYLNLWTADLGNGGFLGYAQFPTASGLSGLEDENEGAETDGVVMHYTTFGSILKVNTPQLELGEPFNLGRTTTHEVGHFLGLLHLWGDGGCASDDFCEDTPNQSDKNYGCVLNSTSCGTLNMVQNFMDYSNDACMNIFTQDQVARMNAVLNISPRRKELQNSTTGTPLEEGIYARFSADKRQICQGQRVFFSNQSISIGNHTITSYQWNFEGGSPQFSTDSEVEVAYNTPGTYKVTLSVRSLLFENTYEIDQYITVISTNTPQNLPIRKDFEDGNGSSNGWAADPTWSISSFNPEGSGSKSLSAENYTVDLRASNVRLFSPLVSVSGIDIIKISFDVAYAARTNVYDTLALLYTTDCGNSYQTVWKKGGNELAIYSDYNRVFRPASDEWRSFSAYLSTQTIQESTVQFVFVNISGNGNQLYLDNINISEATDLLSPIADFFVDKELCLLQENVQFRDNSQNTPFTYEWSLTSANPTSSSETNPTVHYSNEGTFDVSLKVSNPKGSDTERKVKYITAVRGKRLDNVGTAPLSVRKDATGFVTGSNTSGDLAKAEFFSNFGTYEKIWGADFGFGEWEASDLNMKVKCVVWAADGEGNTPNTILAEKEVSYAEIQKMQAIGKMLRVKFNTPITAPTSFYMGVIIPTNGTKVSLKTAVISPNTGWEQKSNSKWLPYSTAVSEGGRALNLRHAIFPILSPDEPLGLDLIKKEELRMNLYPNPSREEIHLDWDGYSIEKIVLYDVKGQIVYSHTPEIDDRSLNFSPFLSSGMYLIKFYTKNGSFVRKWIKQP